MPYYYIPNASDYEFTIPHDDEIEGYLIIRDLTDPKNKKKSSKHSGKPKLALAKNKTTGKMVTLKFPPVDSTYERALIKFQQDGLGEEEIKQKAIEFVNQSVALQERIIQRVQGLSHDHIARLHSFNIMATYANQPYIVSEAIPGLDFYKATRGYNHLQMITFLIPVLDALDFMHKNNLLHLNIKPSKIHANPEATPPIIKLTDYGFAFPLGSKDEQIFGTAYFMAPEAILNQYDLLDARADIYSFAALAYYCFTDHLPFPGRKEAYDDRVQLRKIIAHEEAPPPLTHYQEMIPQELSDFILNLLQANPQDREFSNVHQVLDFFHRTWPEASTDLTLEKTSTNMW